jgi:hypothetical protein
MFEIPLPQQLTLDLIADVCLTAVHMRPDGMPEFLSDEEQVWFWQFVQEIISQGFDESSRHECDEQRNQSAVSLWLWW